MSIKALMKELAIKHLGLHENESKIHTANDKEEAIYGDRDAMISGLSACKGLELPISAMFSDDASRAIPETFSVQLFRKQAKIRSVPISSKSRIMTNLITVVIRYEEKFND